MTAEVDKLEELLARVQRKRGQPREESGATDAPGGATAGGGAGGGSASAAASSQPAEPAPGVEPGGAGKVRRTPLEMAVETELEKPGEQERAIPLERRSSRSPTPHAPQPAAPQTPPRQPQAQAPPARPAQQTPPARPAQQTPPAQPAQPAPGGAPAAGAPSGPQPVEPSKPEPPSEPLVKATGEAAPIEAEATTFGQLLERTLSLRPR